MTTVTSTEIGGIFNLALVLASGFLLCSWEPLRSYLRRQPPPTPYFTFLTVGAIWWMMTPAFIAILERVCEWLHICLPTFGVLMGLDDNFRHGGNALYSAVVFFVVFWLFAERAWTWFLGLHIGGKDIRQRIYDRSLRHLGRGWEFERMVNEAVREGVMIMLTLKNRKVYIGKPLEITRDESGRQRWASIVPWRSGYRNEKTCELELSTNYEQALRDLKGQKDMEFFTMCIPVREIVSSQFFDQVLYDKFQSGGEHTAMAAERGDSEKGGRRKAADSKNISAPITEGDDS